MLTWKIWLFFHPENCYHIYLCFVNVHVKFCMLISDKYKIYSIISEIVLAPFEVLSIVCASMLLLQCIYFSSLGYCYNDHFISSLDIQTTWSMMTAFPISRLHSSCYYSMLYHFWVASVVNSYDMTRFVRSKNFLRLDCKKNISDFLYFLFRIMECFHEYWSCRRFPAIRWHFTASEALKLYSHSDQ